MRRVAGSSSRFPPATRCTPSRCRNRFVRNILTLAVAGWMVASPVAIAPRYVAGRVGDTVQLEDAERQTRVSIVPGVGNNAFAMTIKGHDVLHWPFASVDEFRAKPSLSGIPLLAPWANRLDEAAFYANGKRYAFDMTLGNIRGAIPIHGFLQTTDQWPWWRSRQPIGRRGSRAGLNSSARRRGSSNGLLRTRSRSPIGWRTGSWKCKRPSPTSAPNRCPSRSGITRISG